MTIAMYVSPPREPEKPSSSLNEDNNQKAAEPQAPLQEAKAALNFGTMDTIAAVDSFRTVKSRGDLNPITLRSGEAGNFAVRPESMRPKNSLPGVTVTSSINLPVSRVGITMGDWRFPAVITLTNKEIKVIQDTLTAIPQSRLPRKKEILEDFEKLKRSILLNSPAQIEKLAGFLQVIRQNRAYLSEEVYHTFTEATRIWQDSGLPSTSVRDNDRPLTKSQTGLTDSSRSRKPRFPERDNIRESAILHILGAKKRVIDEALKAKDGNDPTHTDAIQDVVEKELNRLYQDKFVVLVYYDRAQRDYAAVFQKSRGFKPIVQVAFTAFDAKRYKVVIGIRPEARTLASQPHEQTMRPQPIALSPTLKPAPLSSREVERLREEQDNLRKLAYECRVTDFKIPELVLRFSSSLRSYFSHLEEPEYEAALQSGEILKLFGIQRGEPILTQAHLNKILEMRKARVLKAHPELIQANPRGNHPTRGK